MKTNIAFVITLIRGILAVTLGLVLFFQPDKTRLMLANFMGMFWLASGIISLRWGARGERVRGRAMLAGLIGIFTGLAMLGRFTIQRWVAEEIALSLLGVVILLTGVLHAAGGFHIGSGRHLKWSLTSILLGAFEVILGVMVIIEPLGRSKVFYFAASVWAFLGGLILISDGIRIRRVALNSQS